MKRGTLRVVTMKVLIVGNRSAKQQPNFVRSSLAFRAVLCPEANEVLWVVPSYQNRSTESKSVGSPSEKANWQQTRGCVRGSTRTVEG